MKAIEDCELDEDPRANRRTQIRLDYKLDRKKRDDLSGSSDDDDDWN
jgi:hypothetical protein